MKILVQNENFVTQNCTFVVDHLLNNDTFPDCVSLKCFRKCFRKEKNVRSP